MFRILCSNRICLGSHFGVVAVLVDSVPSFVVLRVMCVFRVSTTSGNLLEFEIPSGKYQKSPRIQLILL